MHLKTFTVGILSSIPVLAQAGGSILKRSPAPALENGTYIVDRQAEFANRLTVDFASEGIPPSLQISDYPVNDVWHFSAGNSVVRNGYLELVVTGGSAIPYVGGEITTAVRNIKYASVRTIAILTETPGVCNGMCLYSP